jgi:SAM-dependent methyltransferase
MNPAPPLAPNARLRWSVVKRIVDEVNPVTVLEIGCGQGSFGARLAQGSAYVGVEPDPKSFAVARSRVTPVGGTVLNTTVDGLDDGRFDLVCAFEVIEHLEDDTAALKSWATRVAPAGHILLSMPAWPERFNAWDTLVGHYRRYSPAQARQLLEDAGFADVRVVVYGWPLGYALEAVRAQIAARKESGSEDGGGSMRDRTAGSGRILQPKAVAGAVVEAAVTPFVGLQRLRPTRGTGLVALGTPATGAKA